MAAHQHIQEPRLRLFTQGKRLLPREMLHLATLCYPCVSTYEQYWIHSPQYRKIGKSVNYQDIASLVDGNLSRERIVSTCTEIQTNPNFQQMHEHLLNKAVHDLRWNVQVSKDGNSLGNYSLGTNISTLSRNQYGVLFLLRHESAQAGMRVNWEPDQGQVKIKMGNFFYNGMKVKGAIVNISADGDAVVLKANSVVSWPDYEKFKIKFQTPRAEFTTTIDLVGDIWDVQGYP